VQTNTYLSHIKVSKKLFLGTKVRLELDKAPSSFVLNRSSSDTENYQFKLLEVNLFVPVAVLSLPVYNHLSSTFAEKSVALHYRKTEIREVSLPKNKVEYFSGKYQQRHRQWGSSLPLPNF